MCVYVVWLATLSEGRCELPTLEVINNIPDVNPLPLTHPPLQLHPKTPPIRPSNKITNKNLRNPTSILGQIPNLKTTRQRVPILLLSSQTSNIVLLVHNSLSADDSQ